MKNAVFLIAVCAALTACGGDKPDVLDGLPSSKPVVVPDLPPELAVPAKKLPPLTDNTMGGREVDAAETDKVYNNVAHQTNSLIKLYNCVKEAVNTKSTEISKCLAK